MSEEVEVETPEVAALPVADFNFIMNQPQEELRWVEVPEWNCKVKIKALTKAEQIRLRKASQVRGQIDETKLEMNVLVFSLVEPKLSFAEVDQLFQNANAKALNRLTAAALTFSGLTEDYIQEAEEDMKS
jgi:hypothetical protein